MCKSQDTAGMDKFNYLLTHGMSIESIKRLAESGATIDELYEAAQRTEDDNTELLSHFKTLDNFREEEAKWLIPGWIPEGQITLIAGDGGTAKTTTWINVVAALSSGGACIFDSPEYVREPQKVAFITTEDSIKKKLVKKLREAGANMKNIITVDFAEDRDGILRDLKFGTPEMESFLRHFKPALCVFDPVQGFIPPMLNMGSRNAMRDCLAPLAAIGEDTGTTFIIICHSNKRKGAWGRDRIADSADLWDIARSVIMAGYTEDEGIRYLSNEKNNYGQLQETILFSVNDKEQLQKEGTSWKRDREFVQSAELAKTAPIKEGCKEYIIKTLNDAGGDMPTKELEEKAKRAGYARRTIRRAKDELKEAGEVRYFQSGRYKDKVWRMELVKVRSVPN